MALTKCPECANEVSDKAYSCPHCGYIMSSSAQSSSLPKPTPVGPQNKQALAGGAGTVAGMAMIVVGILLAFVILPLGIIIAIVGGVLLSKGNAAAVGTHSITCPYCKTPGTIETPAQSYRCPACSKKSVKRDGYMHPVP